MKNRESKKVVLFGVGKWASIAHLYLTHASPYEPAGFTVDREYWAGDNLHGLPVVPFDHVEDCFPPDEYQMFACMSYKQVNKLRAAKYHEAKAKGYSLMSYISPKAAAWPGLVVGDNCFIMENNAIGPFVEIGNNVIMGAGNHNGHNSIIKDHCFLAGHTVISGNVTVEPYCFLGVNATVRDDITIARECVVGAGALLLKDTHEREVYAGKPAQLIPWSSDKLSKI